MGAQPRGDRAELFGGFCPEPAALSTCLLLLPLPPQGPLAGRPPRTVWKENKVIKGKRAGGEGSCTPVALLVYGRGTEHRYREGRRGAVLTAAAGPRPFPRPPRPTGCSCRSTVHLCGTRKRGSHSGGAEPVSRLDAVWRSGEMSTGSWVEPRDQSSQSNRAGEMDLEHLRSY